MQNKIYTLLFGLLTVSLPVIADTIPSSFSQVLKWRVGAEVAPAYVPNTNGFLKGNNPDNKTIHGKLSGSIHGDFSFNPATREGMLYKGLYQGVGVGVNAFFANRLFGMPVSAYVYQGAPIIHFNDRLWLGYEWQFGAAFGWKYFNEETAENNVAVSTPVTAYMGLSLKLHYKLTDRWQMAFGIDAKHYSNGNTSWPNAGVNSIGASIGLAYILNPQNDIHAASRELQKEADCGEWLYDITAFGAWHKQIVNVGDPAEAQLCPGKFGVAGMQFSPMRKLNRWVAIGPALDLQWDESGGLAPYWVEGSTDDNIKFERPPFGKQLSVGVSAHAELTMPIFSVNVGLGYDFVNPKGGKRFYQSLTLKTFVTEHIFLNVGYRLGSFKVPQNLMIGVGVRL